MIILCHHAFYFLAFDINFDKYVYMWEELFELNKGKSFLQHLNNLPTSPKFAKQNNKWENRHIQPNTNLPMEMENAYHWIKARENTKS